MAETQARVRLGFVSADHLHFRGLLRAALECATADVVGMVVDSVSDVITLTAEQIKPAPAMGSVLDTDYLIGLGTLDERMLILVDIDRLMSSEEMGLVEATA